MKSCKAVNPKHQKTVNKFLKADSQYSSRIDQLHSKDLDDCDDSLASKFYENGCHHWNNLPKREQQNIIKQTLITGY